MQNRLKFNERLPSSERANRVCSRQLDPETLYDLFQSEGAGERSAKMRRWAILMLLCCGCSTSPIADMCDYFCPGKIKDGAVAPYGGVCNPTPGVVTPGPIAPLPGAPAGAFVPAAPTAPAQALPPPIFPNN
jgi:hypothetical protein